MSAYINAIIRMATVIRSDSVIADRMLSLTRTEIPKMLPSSSPLASLFIVLCSPLFRRCRRWSLFSIRWPS